MMRTSRALRLPLVLVLAALPLAPGTGRASCAAATVGASPQLRRAGDAILVTGEGWGGSCADSESCGACGRCTSQEDRQPAVREVEILLERAGMGAGAIELQTIELDGTDSFAQEVRLPRRLAPGRYVIVAVGSQGGERSRTPFRVVR